MSRIFIFLLSSLAALFASWWFLYSIVIVSRHGDKIDQILKF